MCDRSRMSNPNFSSGRGCESDSLGCIHKVVRKLVVATPSSELVDAYLWEIAKAYGVNWAPLSVIKLKDTKDDDDTQGGVAVRF